MSVVEMHVPDDLMAEIREVVRSEGVSVEHVVQVCIREGLARRRPRPPLPWIGERDGGDARGTSVAAGPDRP